MIPLLLFFAAAGDHGFGVLPPVQLPDITVTTEDNRRIGLRSLAKDQAVAVQFVFTDCATVCPLLGSLFQSVERRLDNRSPILLLSVSVNPERDDSERLKLWLAGFRNGQRWRAVHTSPADLQTLLAAFGQKNGPPVEHSSQVFFVKTNGEVFGRTTGLPDSAGVAEILRRLR